MNFVKEDSYIRGIIAILLFATFLIIVLTLIINPKALNPKVNDIISMIFGALLGWGGFMIHFYFDKTNKQQ